VVAVETREEIIAEVGVEAAVLGVGVAVAGAFNTMSAAIAEAPDKLAAATAFRSNLIYRSSWMMGQKPATKYCPLQF